MDRREFMRGVVGAALASGSVSALAGCGTLLHQERIGQPHSRDVDWRIVALNSLGLAFFFVPGVVAFAVDFYTGAIYLPPEYYPAEPLQPALGRRSASPAAVTPVAAEISGPANGPANGPASGAPVAAPVAAPSSHPNWQPPAPVHGAAVPGRPQPGAPQYGGSQHGAPLHGAASDQSAVDLRTFRVPPESLTLATIEQTVSRHVGRAVSLNDRGVRVSPLDRLDRFAAHYERHASDPTYGRRV